MITLITTSCINTNKKNIILVGNKKVYIEISDTDEKRKVGLMNRKFLKKNHGMLFVFNEEVELGFWMKNTLIPLSIGFFNKKCELVSMQEMKLHTSNDSQPQTYFSETPATYALEMNKGWFQKTK